MINPQATTSDEPITSVEGIITRISSSISVSLMEEVDQKINAVSQKFENQLKNELKNITTEAGEHYASREWIIQYISKKFLNYLPSADSETTKQDKNETSKIVQLMDVIESLKNEIKSNNEDIPVEWVKTQLNDIFSLIDLKKEGSEPDDKSDRLISRPAPMMNSVDKPFVVSKDEELNVEYVRWNMNN